METTPKRKSKSGFSFLILFFGLTPLIAIALLFYFIATGHFGFMPGFEELENPKSNLASEMISSDGELLGKYYIQNRSFVSFHDLSPNLVNALIATEDYRFFSHSGIDGRSLMRVVYGIVSGHRKGGGSTITQQLAKNLFPRDTTHYHSKIAKVAALATAKFKEWVTAVKLERQYSKEEILTMYLNTVFFGSGTYGIKSAARTFFNTTPDSLTIEQAAVLVGVLKAPTYYSPVLNPENSLKRRNVVLGQMLKYHFINQAVYDSLKQLPIVLKYNIQTHRRGLATYFREYIRLLLTAKKPQPHQYYSHQQYYEDSLEWATNPAYGWCNKHKKSNGEPYNLYKDGLKIYVTLNAKMQRFAENAVRKHLKDDLQQKFDQEQKGRKKAPFAWNVTEKQIRAIMISAMKRTPRYRQLKRAGIPFDSIMAIFHKPVHMRVFSWDGPIDTIMSPWDSIRYHKQFLNAGLISIEPATGYVRAYVGGIDYSYFQFDHVTAAKRQVGSTFKPFLYTLAMQEGYSPCYKVPNVPVTFELPDGKTWSPKNADETKYDGKMVTLKWGLANSVNNISAWLMKQFSPQAVINIVRNMGIVSYIDPVPSIALGTPDISLYEMAGAFNTFVNKGIYVKPIFITRIENKNGTVLQTFKAPRHETMKEETAYLMINLLQAVIDHGTGVRLRFKYGLKSEIAGKTGTTQNQSDGWFMGLVPKLTTSVWVGGEDRAVHFRGIRYGQGANMALPIFALYLKQIYADSTLGILPSDRFFKPQETHIIVDCNEYDKQHKSENISIQF